MGLQLKNNATTVLAGAIIATDTTFAVQAGTGSKFPALAAGDYFPATIVDSSGNYEIVKVTARAVDVLTVVRAQEGTTALAFAADSRIDLRITAGILAVFSEKAANLTDLLDAAAARAALGLGNAAIKNTGATAGTVAAGDDARIIGAAQEADLGDAAFKDTGTAVGTVAAGNDSRIVNAVQSADIGSAAALDAGTADGNVVVVQAGGKLPALNGAALTGVHPVFHIQERQNSGVNSDNQGVITGAAYIGVALNYDVINTIPGASRVGNVVTLPLGTYRTYAEIGGLGNGGVNKLRVRDTMNSVTVGNSLAQQGDSIGASGIPKVMTLLGHFNIAGNTTFRLEAYINNSFSSVKGNTGEPEIYSNLIFEKIG